MGTASHGLKIVASVERESREAPLSQSALLDLGDPSTFSLVNLRHEVVARFARQCREIQRLLEARLKARVTSLVADFVRDRNNILWLIGLRHYTYAVGGGDRKGRTEHFKNTRASSLGQLARLERATSPAALKTRKVSAEPKPTQPAVGSKLAFCDECGQGTSDSKGISQFS